MRAADIQETIVETKASIGQQVNQESEACNIMAPDNQEYLSENLNSIESNIGNINYYQWFTNNNAETNKISTAEENINSIEPFLMENELFNEICSEFADIE